MIISSPKSAPDSSKRRRKLFTSICRGVMYPRAAITVAVPMPRPLPTGAVVVLN